MTKQAERFQQCDRLISRFEQVCRQAAGRPGAKYRCGVDLGTACVVLAVVDETGRPVAGRYEYAHVVQDGMVVDYLGAVRIVERMKREAEQALGGAELPFACAAVPPGTQALDGGVVKNVVEGAGFELTGLLEESTAANAVLQISSGAIVDVGGGTTGISVLQDGQVVYTADEPTGGIHFTLTLAGAMGVSVEEAERYKRDPAHHREILPVLRPVAEKVAAIVLQHIAGRDVKEIYLVGGTSCLTGIEDIVARGTGIPTYKPRNPLFVTPLGIALNCRAED